MMNALRLWGSLADVSPALHRAGHAAGMLEEMMGLITRAWE